MRETQHQKIYNYMKQHGSITPMECFDKLQITKLATRIGEMRRNGIPIGSEMIQTKNTRCMKYWLLKAGLDK